MRKLIYISHWRFPSDKTMSPLIMRTCEGLALQGIEVELWVPRRINSQYPEKDPFAHYGVKAVFRIRKLPVLDLMEHTGGSLSFLLMTFSFALSVWWSGRFVPDNVIWYSHDLRDIIFLKKKNLFVEIHDFYESRLNFLNTNVLARARGLVVTNKVKMRHIEKKYHVPEERMLNLPNAVDNAHFNSPLTKDEARKKLSLPLDKKLVIYTGSLFAWKGIHTLAFAAWYLPENIEIIFAGGNENDRENFKKFIGDNKLSGISLLPLPYEDAERAPLLMRAADVLALPNTAKDPASKYETSPVKLFEYMCSGTPIVASDLPSIRDVISEKEVFFFEPDNPQNLADTIRKVLEYRSEAESRAKVSQKEAVKYSWEEKSKAIIRFIESLSPNF